MISSKQSFTPQETSRTHPESELSSLPLFLGFLWIVFDSRKQGWHDKLAGTVVVQRKGGATDQVRFEQPMA